jgi:4-hydroxy-tetrahydrodipicolinate synthase
VLLALQGITCWSGNDDEAHAARHLHGAAGVISVTSNVIPGLFSRLMRERDDKTAAELLPLIQWLFHEPNPIALNTSLSMLGLCKPVFRMPYVPTTKARREEGAKLLQPWLEHIPGNTGVKVLEDKDFLLVSNY